MSDATMGDPQVRATQNKWYLYCDRGPRFGPSGYVRAVIEEVCDEIWSGDDGPTRARRFVYLKAKEVATTNRPQGDMEVAASDGLDWHIENEMSDEEFKELIDNGTIIPITTPPR